MNAHATAAAAAVAAASVCCCICCCSSEMLLLLLVVLPVLLMLPLLLLQQLLLRAAFVALQMLIANTSPMRTFFHQPQASPPAQEFVHMPPEEVLGDLMTHS